MTRKSASDVESLRRKVASLEKENKQLRKLVSESKRIPKYVPPPSTINEGTILSFGLSLVGIPKWQTCCARLKMRRFRSHFGVGPRAIVALVSDMKRTQNKPINLTYLFVAISWLKIYETEEQMAGRWGYGEQHCRETVLDYVKRIQAMKKWKISFRRISTKSRFLPVDTVHLRCQEFRCTPDSKGTASNLAALALRSRLSAIPTQGTEYRRLRLSEGRKEGQAEKHLEEVSIIFPHSKRCQTRWGLGVQFPARQGYNDQGCPRPQDEEALRSHEINAGDLLQKIQGLQGPSRVIPSWNWHR